MRSSSSGRTGSLAELENLFLLACLVVFALFLWASYGMEETSAYLLPRWLAVLGLAVTLAQLAVSYRRPGAAQEEGGGAERGVHVLASIAFAALYFSLVPVLGFVLATALAIGAFAYLTRFPRPRLVAALALGVPMALHLAFAGLLKAPLPPGVLVALPF